MGRVEGRLGQLAQVRVPDDVLLDSVEQLELERGVELVDEGIPDQGQTVDDPVARVGVGDGGIES